jgi:hypothetical protein
MRALVRLAIKHPVIDHVERDIFRVTFTADCMQHKCRCRDEKDRRRNDACCQYGADVLIPEKGAILRRATEIASVLKPHRRDAACWFDERDPELDPGAPEGIILRTATSDPDGETSGCIFLEHTGRRGCGLHRAALVHGFDPAEIKPRACRLYPLSWNDRWLGLSPEFNSYSCAHDGGPTVYRLMRPVIASMFDATLIQELDRVESNIARRALRVVSATPPVPDSAVE